MALQVTGKNLDVGEALRTVTGRMATVLDKYAGQTPSGHARIETAHGAFPAGCTAQPQPGLSLAAHGEAPEPDDDSPAVVRELPVGDAVAQLDLASRPLLVFQNASHGGMNVAYGRDDGNIGRVDPGGTRPGTESFTWGPDQPLGDQTRG